MEVVCFGDSNTWGYDPRSFLGDRYPEERRWPDILGKYTGWNITNKGVNGQEIPQKKIQIPVTADILIVMLGTNDLLQGCAAKVVADKIYVFLKEMVASAEKILLIAPPPMKPGAWASGMELICDSSNLSKYYRIIADNLGILFVDAGDWNIPMAYDGVHFTEEGHLIFARELFYSQIIRKLLVATM